MIIAVSKYGNDLHDLDFCENDGRGIYNTLISHGYDINKKNVLIGQVMGTEMRDSILDFFNDDEIRSNDVVLFYFSGHGVPDLDTVYLASSDTDPKLPSKRGFSLEDLRVMMNKCISTKVVTILDSCYAGSARLGKGPTDAAVLASQLISRRASQDEGKCILAAAQSFQEAFGMKDGEGSVFTHYVIKGLQGDLEAADNRGNITPDTLGRYVYDKVTSIYPNQKPIRKVEASGEIILASISASGDMKDKSSINSHTLIEQANNLFSIGEYDQALTQYNKILQIEPRNTQVWNNKGKTYEKLIMYNEALQCFDRAIQIDSKDHVLWYNKGNIFAKIIKSTDALRCYDMAISLNSKDSSCWKNKAYVLSKMGNDLEAKKCLAKALELGKKS